MNVRFAEEKELDRVNELRKQVSRLHAAGKPDVFKAGFPQEMQDLVYVFWNDPEKKIVVVEKDGVICGYAVLHHMCRAENPVKREQNYLDIDEFGVDEAYRRQGVAAEMIDFIRAYTVEKGIRRIELNMWEFNKGALAFYESVGFRTFRRYMEMFVE